MRLLARWLSRYERSSSANDPDLAEALERAAGRVGPFLKQSRGWPRRFRQPIAAALAQARQVARSIPGPVELDADRYTSDPLVHALFASAEHIRTCLNTSEPLRDYATSGAVSEVYMLLSARREEKQIYGIEEHGGILRRDVPQRVLWYTDHRFTDPAATSGETRDKLTWTLFGRFLERLAVGFERLRADKARLTREKELTLSRLRNIDATRRSDSQHALKTVLKQLGDATESLELDHLHEVFETVLSHPEDCLFLRSHPVTLDGMGVIRAELDGQGATTLTCTDLVERYHEPRTVMLVHCRDFRPMAQADNLSVAKRLLF